MIDKSFVDAIVGLSVPTVISANGREFTTRAVHNTPLPEQPIPAPLAVSTLTGIVDYVNAYIPEGPDNLLHVVSYHRVDLITKIDGERKLRSIFVTANCEEPKFTYGAFYPHAQFMIALQYMFADYGDRAKVLKILGTVKAEDARTSMDDGVTQRVTASAGVTLAAEVPVPNPVMLQPFRTFLEVQQPPSLFVLRVQSKKDSLPECALFEADGGRWKSEAILLIREYLTEKTKGVTVIA